MDSKTVISRIDKILTVKRGEIEQKEIEYATLYYDHKLCIAKLEELIELHKDVHDLEDKRMFYNTLKAEIMIDEPK